MRASRAAFILTALALGGCADLAPRGRDLPAEMDHRAMEPVPLAGEVLGAGVELGLPYGLRLVGEHAVLVDQAADSVIHVLRRADGGLVRAFGRRGAGPGEFEGVWSLAPVPGAPDEFWIWDAGLRRLTHVDIRTDLVEGMGPGGRSVNVFTETPILDVYPLGDRWVGVGFMESGRLAYFDTEGRPLGTVGELPPGDDEVPASVRQQVNQSYLAVKPDQSLLAVATRHFDRLEIYRPDGTLVARGTEPFGLEPAYQVRLRDERAGMATGGDLRFGYVGLAATDRHIYALFSGRTRAGFPGQANYGEHVHVYDWEGQLLRVLKLDAAAIALDVDPGERALYAVAHHPAPALLRYRLGGGLEHAAAGPLEAER